jgi:hypothetical protein
MFLSKTLFNQKHFEWITIVARHEMDSRIATVAWFAPPKPFHPSLTASTSFSKNSIDASSSVIVVQMTETRTQHNHHLRQLLSTEGAASKELFGGDRKRAVVGGALDAISSLVFVTIETSANESGFGFRFQFREKGGTDDHGVFPPERNFCCFTPPPPTQ